MIDVSGYIDHTVLKPSTVVNDVKKLCSEAAEYHFAAVCIPPPFVKTSKKLLTGTEVKVSTVIGFPFGYSNARAKLAEVQQALTDGADELDAVINLSALKNGSWSYLESEMDLLIHPIHDAKKIVKVIIETGMLTDEEIIKCCEIYTRLKVDFLKTSTGYAETGATIKAVQLLRANLPSSIKIKASGGIRTYESAVQFIEAGADRIGCSAGVEIMKQQAKANV
jgi:deoxyribose-phosphate aldolase